jgi:hypothetical protein
MSLVKVSSESLTMAADSTKREAFMDIPVTNRLLPIGIIANAILLVACQVISDVPATDKPAQDQQAVTSSTPSEKPGIERTKAPVVPEDTAIYEAPLTYENAPFTFENPSALEVYQNGDYDPKSREKLTDPSFEDIRYHVVMGRIVTFNFIEHGEQVYTSYPAGDFVIDALLAIPNGGSEYYLGVRHVETGGVELVPVDPVGVVLNGFAENWQSYTPNEP